MNINDVKQIPEDSFSNELSSRLSGGTVAGLHINEDGEYRLPSYTGLSIIGWNRSIWGCDKDTTAVMIESTTGVKFWMHIGDYRELK